LTVTFTRTFSAIPLPPQARSQVEEIYSCGVEAAGGRWQVAGNA
jgi:hypothetical protein